MHCNIYTHKQKKNKTKQRLSTTTSKPARRCKAALTKLCETAPWKINRGHSHTSLLSHPFLRAPLETVSGPHVYETEQQTAPPGREPWRKSKEAPGSQWCTCHGAHQSTHNTHTQRDVCRLEQHKPKRFKERALKGEHYSSWNMATRCGMDQTRWERRGHIVSSVDVRGGGCRWFGPTLQ